MYEIYEIQFMDTAKLSYCRTYYFFYHDHEWVYKSYKVQLEQSRQEMGRVGF